jgi:hypothetical protein
MSVRGDKARLRGVHARLCSKAGASKTAAVASKS